MNPDGSARGFGYVSFVDQEAATALFESGAELLGRPLRIDYTQPRPDAGAGRPLGSSPPARPAAPPGRTLFVGNMPFGAEESDIRDKFEPFGPLKSVRLSTRPTGESRGFAHVEFLREEDAIAAFTSFVEEPLYMLDRNVRVDYAPVRPTSSNPPSHKLYFFDYRGNEEALRLSLKDFETSIQRTYFRASPFLAIYFFNYTYIQRQNRSAQPAVGGADGLGVHRVHVRRARVEGDPGAQRLNHAVRAVKSRVCDHQGGRFAPGGRAGRGWGQL